MLGSFCFKLQSDLSELLQPALRPQQLETKRVSEKKKKKKKKKLSRPRQAWNLKKPCKDDVPLTRHLTYIAFTVRGGRKSEVPQDLLFSSKLAKVNWHKIFSIYNMFSLSSHEIKFYAVHSPN